MRKTIAGLAVLLTFAAIAVGPATAQQSTDVLLAAFVTTVTDANYDHVGYQVSGTLSNLYLFNAEHGRSRPAGRTTPLRPGARGRSDRGSPEQRPRRRQQQAPDEGCQRLRRLVGGCGQPPAVRRGVRDSDLGLLMSGDASSLGGFVNGLLSDLEDLVDGITASDMVGAGTIDAAAAQAAAAEAVQGLEDDINAELVGLGLDPIPLPQTGAVIDQVLNDLLVLLSLADLIGQTGVGAAVPKLEAAPDSAPVAGVYKGRMVVTLVDVP